jgi:hypothetical protein
MGGTRSASFARFVGLCIQGFLAMRRSSCRILLLVEMLSAGRLPSLGADDSGIAELKVPTARPPSRPHAPVTSLMHHRTCMHTRMCVHTRNARAHAHVRAHPHACSVPGARGPPNQGYSQGTQCNTHSQGYQWKKGAQALTNDSAHRRH